jgi:hypothetical protein
VNDLQVLQEIAAEFDAQQDVSVGKWFGKPCLKVGAKVFATLWDGDMAFKLAGEAHAEALQLKGAQLFDPRDEGHPMKQWVQIPATESSAWSRFARLACTYVAGAAQAEKEAIISSLVEARRKVMDAARSLPGPQQDVIFLGEWSVKDLLAHLAGWDDTNIQAVQEILAGQRPSFWQHHDRDWQSYNAQLVAKYRRDDFAELLAVVEASHRRLIDYLQTVPADEHVKKRKILTLLRTEIKDCLEHCQQLQEFARSSAH